MFIGIDLGTTNSLSAYLNDSNNIEVIVNEKGSRLTPSIVFFRSKDEVIVGDTVLGNNILEADKVIKNIKRHIGTDFKIVIEGREYTPVEISSVILRKLKQYSENFIGQQLEDVVITVPAYFNYKQRVATKRAGEIAGFKNIKIINEPTASALAYNVFYKEDANILVIDIGGGTFDITLMEYRNKVQTVVATGGDISLGGIDFDKKIVDTIIEDFYNKYNIDLSKDAIAYNQIQLTAKKAKEDLSTLDSVAITIPYITISEQGPLHIRYDLNRDKFNNIVEDLLNRIEKLIIKTFREVNISFDWVDKILFVGGSTRIPVLKERIIKLFETKGGKSADNLIPDRKLNPDEAVAIGAAIYGAKLDGRIEDIEFYDVISYYLGIEEDDGDFNILVNKNDIIPIKKSRIFTTVKDFQEFIKIKIIGKRDLEDKDIIEFGEFVLENLPNVEAGKPDIEVEFSFDSNGILHVSAMDLDTANENKITIMDFYSTEQFKDEKRGQSIKII